MIEMPNMLMIAGNARNIGKTTLACTIIERFSAYQKIIGLKVTSMRKGEDGFHGNHGNEETEMLKIYEEVNKSSAKDTARMLSAGAAKAFYVRADDASLGKTAEQLADMIPSSQIVVCESSSLRNVIKPGAFIYLYTDEKGRPVKKNRDLANLADLVIDCTQGIHAVTGNFKKVNISENRWIINN